MQHFLRSIFLGLILPFQCIALYAQNIEVEPNQTKSSATVVSLTTNNQTIAGGINTNSDTDYFRFYDAITLNNIRENTITLTTTGSAITQFQLKIHGVEQASGASTTNETIVQVSNNSLTPAIRWYSFGKNETVTVSVSCTSPNNEPYTLTWVQQGITTSNVAAVIPNGRLTLTTENMTTSHNNTDLWVYDANFLPVANFGNDETSTGSRASLTRNFTAGTYYLAVTNENLANNQASPQDDAFRNGNLTDAANMLTSSGLNSGNIPVKFITPYFNFVQNPNLSNTRNFRVIWIKFTVINVAITFNKKQLCNGNILTVNVQANPVNATAFNSGNVSALLSDNTGNFSSPLQTQNLQMNFANNSFSGSCSFLIPNSPITSEKYKVALSALSQIFYSSDDSLQIFNLNTATIPTSAGTYTANGQCTDLAGWTHYYNTTNNQALLQIQKGTNAANIGNIGDAGFGVEVTVTPQYGAQPIDLGLNSATPAPYTNANHWWLMSRCWNVSLKNGGSQPSGAVAVRTYFDNQDFSDLQNAVSSNGGNLSSMNQLIFYKINGEKNPSPTTYHNGVNIANNATDDGIRLYQSGSVASLVTYLLGDENNYHYAEMFVMRFSGGGAGVTSTGLMPLPAETFFLEGDFSDNQNAVNLKWNHFDEKKTSHYAILKADETMTWQTFGQFYNVDKDNLAGTYMYQDEMPNAGKNFYKVQKIDIDGNVVESNVIQLSAFQHQFSANIFPNPVIDNAQLAIYHNFETTIQVEILDASGKIIWQNKEAFSAGNQQIMLPTETLTSGIYYCKIKAEGQAAKMIIMTVNH